MFFIPMTIPEFALSSFFTVTVWTPGGTAISFAQSWNCEQEFFVDNPFIQKINSASVKSHFLPKNKTKQPKDCNQIIARCC